MERRTLLAFDDTDSVTGGCTTHLAFHVLLALPHLALSGMPRLVRLNPNVPHKTRGNGAVVLPLGRPQGPHVRVGELRGHEVRAFPEAAAAAPSRADLDAVWAVVRAQAQPEAQPSVALIPEPLPAAAYWQAVRSRGEPADAADLLDEAGALWETTTGRSLVGCAAAAAWPGPPSSFEFLAYREPPRWGTPRAVVPEPLRSLDGTRATFHTWDPVEERLACVPRGPDPVLLGLRGRDPEALEHAAMRTLPWAAGEPVDAWLLWATNQASSDHVTPVAGVAEAPVWGTISVPAEVMGDARPLRGGRVQVELRDGAGTAFSALAFEPTKGFRDAVRALRAGDRVRAVGAWEPGSWPAGGAADGGEAGLAGAGWLKLEKLEVVSLVEVAESSNPSCPTCGRSMKSAGAGQGYRCRECGTKAPSDAVTQTVVARDVRLGWHEVPVVARRHLHRPVAFEPDSRA